MQDKLVDGVIFSQSKFVQLGYVSQIKIAAGLIQTFIIIACEAIEVGCLYFLVSSVACTMVMSLINWDFPPALS